MVSSMLLGPFSWIADFFHALFDLIPKIMYLLYASLACVLDVLQLFFRKLAGLDVYYIDGEAVAGDLVTNFVTGILQPFLPGIDRTGHTYPILSTVFWAMIIFGIIICFACTIVAIIKSHYNYDDKAAKGPMQYVYTAGKAVINMIAVPLIVVLGLWVSEGILTALDSITSISSGNIEAQFDTNLLESVDTVKAATGKSSDRTYIYYDIFGYGGGILYGKGDVPQSVILGDVGKKVALIGSTNQTFSGSLFRTAAYNANRARIGQFSLNKKDTFTGANAGEIFGTAEDDEELAEMIDTAFACSLRLKKEYRMDLKYVTSDTDGNGVWTSLKYFTNFLTQHARIFTKFNVGLVWYYYDLWQFNFIVGFAGVIVCASIFINIVLGLMTRLVMCVGLFLIAPPLFGLAPLDGGEAGKNWRKNFMEQILMAYGSVVGMNIVLLILPYLNEIDFFNIAIADYFARTLFIIVGLITIKAFIAVVSKLVGGADANKTGGDIAKEVGSVAGKATKMTVGAARLGTTALGSAARVGLNAARTGGNLIGAGMDRIRAHRADARGDAAAAANLRTRAQGRMANARLNARRTGRAIVYGGRDVALGFSREMLDDLNKNVFGGSDLYKEFKENSFWRKEDYMETTARNTGEMLRAQQRSNQIQEYSVRNPATGTTEGTVQLSTNGTSRTRGTFTAGTTGTITPPPRRGGRPKGSKNRPKEVIEAEKRAKEERRAARLAATTSGTFEATGEHQAETTGRIHATTTYQGATDRDIDRATGERGYVYDANGNRIRGNARVAGATDINGAEIRDGYGNLVNAGNSEADRQRRIRQEDRQRRRQQRRNWWNTGI